MLAPLAIVSSALPSSPAITAAVVATDDDDERNADSDAADRNELARKDGCRARRRRS